MAAGGSKKEQFPQEATLTGTSLATSYRSAEDTLLAELFQMGFPLDVTAAAINQLGSLNRDEVLEIMLGSGECPPEAAKKEDDGGHHTPDTARDTMQEALLPVKQEEVDQPAISRGGRSGKNQINRINDSLDTVEETSTSRASQNSPLLLRLLEMGCRPDVAEKAYEIYGGDPMYGSEDERLDVMCDFVAAVDLNDEDVDPEAEDQEIVSSQALPVEAGIEEWFASRRETEDSRTLAPVQTRRPLHSDRTGMEQKQYAEEYTPGGYYKYIREDDPDQEELFRQDLEEQEIYMEEQEENSEGQEDSALYAMKRKSLREQVSSSTSVRIRGTYRRPQVGKSFMGPVIRRIRVPHYTNMTGYGVPGSPVIRRNLPLPDLDGPPYFYFENVAFMPGDEWDTISRHLYDIEPEFVNAYHFTVCKRPRGYVHNLPVEGRFEIIPRAPRTIKELVPYCTPYWPSWDDRTTFNCICTSTATESTIKPVMTLLGCLGTHQEPPHQIRRQIMDILKMYNMVWVGPGHVAKPKVEELEVCMGFDPDHTRPILSTNQQINGLGNAFQVQTVGYHLSVLKKIFPKGLNVLSLFTGIGGAEVALHRLGIDINVAVCVEIDPKVRRVIEHWWKVTNQSGRLITKYEDVNALDCDTLRQLMVEVGGFDLVVGGSPCSNLSAKNRFSRMGLAGKASVAFFEYSRILRDVRTFGLRYKRQGFCV